MSILQRASIGLEGEEAANTLLLLSGKVSYDPDILEVRDLTIEEKVAACNSPLKNISWYGSSGPPKDDWKACRVCGPRLKPPAAFYGSTELSSRCKNCIRMSQMQRKQACLIWGGGPVQQCSVCKKLKFKCDLYKGDAIVQEYTVCKECFEIQREQQRLSRSFQREIALQCVKKGYLTESSFHLLAQKFGF